MIYDIAVNDSARPGDWHVRSIRQLAEVIGGGTPDTTEPAYWNPPEVPWVTPTDITACEDVVLTDTERSISSEGLRNSSAALLPLGSTLLTSRATVGECRLAGREVATNQGLASLVPLNGTDSIFLFYLAQMLKPVFLRLASGTTFIEVSRREIRRVNVCVPLNENECAQIGRILRAADEASAEQQRKLRALRRLKTALMQELFTRGIPGHKAFKKARVFRHEFEVPEAWDIEPLRSSVTAVEYGTNAPSNDEKHGLPVIAIPEIIAPRFRLSECSYVELPLEEANALRLQSDDVLLIRTNGNADYIGKSTVIGEETAAQHVVFASYLIRVRTVKKKLSGRYLNYFLASPLGRRLCLAMANTSAGNHNLGSRAIKQFVFPRPSPEEQVNIVALVDSSEDAIEAAEKEIKAIDCLKRSLLHNLLTGRVRVRI